jgi:hypothetical protein
MKCDGSVAGDKKLIDYFSSRHPLALFRSRMSWKARKKMYDLFWRLLSPRKEHKVLDVGVTPDTSMPDSNFFEQVYPYKQSITAVSIEDTSGLAEKFPGITFQTISTGRLPFKDKEFDIVFCSAVVEHVGSTENQRFFISEVIRVSKSFFITTPNRWYPIEFHTILPLIHWLPKPLHRKILKMLGYDVLSKEENLNLLSSSEIASWGVLPEHAQISSMRFFGIPSNLIIHGTCTQDNSCV